MTAKCGYYSLVQFYPNPSRAEAVNLGVVLFLPRCRVSKPRCRRATSGP